jgi:hypothetical protein
MPLIAYPKKVYNKCFEPGIIKISFAEGGDVNASTKV